MTGIAAPVRSASLKDLQRLLSVSGIVPERKRGRPKAVSLPHTAYPDMSRREREHHRRYHAERLNDTDAAAAENYWSIKIASLALEPYGIQLIPNDRVFHIYDEWPQGVRRRVSGSIWDGRKLIWRKPKVTTLWQIPMPPMGFRLSNGPKIKCAHRSWKGAEQLIAAKRDPIKPRQTDAAAADALLTAIGHLANPGTKRAATYLNEGINDLIKAKRTHVPDPVTVWRPWWQLANPRYWQGKLPYSEADLIKAGGFVTTIHRKRPCTWAFPATEWPLDCIGAPVFREKLGAGEAWFANIAGTLFRDNPYGDDPAAEAKPCNSFLYRPGIAPLQRPVVSRDEPFRAVARLWNWQINNRHREQMRTVWPEFACHSEYRRVDRPRAFPDDRGGQCCRWTNGGFKTCLLQCWSRQK